MLLSHLLRLRYAAAALPWLLVACSHADRSTNPPPAVPEKSAAAPAAPAPAAETAAPIGPRREFSPDSLARFFRPDAGIVYAQLRGDTLWLASTAEFVYYPFGRCADWPCAKSRYVPLVVTAVNRADPASEAIYRAQHGHSEVTLVQSEDEGKNTVQVIAGTVRDADVKLVNGVAVGEPLARFLPRFFREPLDARTRAAIKVVRLDSGLERIRHHYLFPRGVLTTITFREV